MDMGWEWVDNDGEGGGGKMAPGGGVKKIEAARTR